MSRTFVWTAQEETGVAVALCDDGEPPPEGLDALDWRILGAWSEAKNWTTMAAEVGVSTPRLRLRVKRPAFQAALTRLQRNFFNQIARGEYGAMALLKANRVGLVQRLLGMSRGATDERVRLTATLEAIKLSGLQAPKPVVIDNPERLLDLMTADELDHFSKTNEMPVRLADKVVRLAATALTKRPSVTEGHVDGEVVDASMDFDGDPRRAGPREEADVDEVVTWGAMPVETEDVEEVGA